MPRAFGPTVQFRYQRELEPPDPAEGFSRIDVVSFERRPTRRSTNRAVIVWCDGVLLRSRSGQRTPSSTEDVEVVGGRGEVLRRYEADGWRVLGLSWQPEIADEPLTPPQVEADFARMRELLGSPSRSSTARTAPDRRSAGAGNRCPGLGVVLIQRHQLDASQCIYVGNGPQDPGFARRLGFQYRDAAGFFALRYHT